MKIKPIYINRIKTLKTQINNHESFVIGKKSVVDNYIKDIEKKLSEIKDISNDENIEPNIKYIVLNEKATEIEKITSKIENIYKDINKESELIEKEISILIKNCIEVHNSFNEEEVVLEIKKMLF